MIPRATYRTQFHKDFPFVAAEEIAPYLRDLGISHLYASPIAAARAGSNHGYDVIDPTRINPELGGEDGFRRLAATLKAHGIGIVLDIVPNHMAVGGADNDWWLSVLEQGTDSPYACYFDIDWTPADPALCGKLLAPFLGMPLAEAIADGEVRVVRDERGVAVMAHDTHRFPLCPDDQAPLRELSDAELAERFDAVRPEGRECLAKLLGRQHYQLSWWRTAPDRINWRRFFDITELAGLRVEDQPVFDAVHELPLRLYAEGLIDGVRVDHVDGLANPPEYCRRLRAAFDARRAERQEDTGPAWLIVEKILGEGEALPAAWQTDGTSGYDFMDRVSALLHDPAGETPLTRHWHELSGRPADFHAEEDIARGEILDRTFPGQLDAVAHAFYQLALIEDAGSEVTHGMLRRALTTLLTHFRVYRTYANDGNAELAPVMEAARRAATPGEGFVLYLIDDWIGGTRAADHPLRREAVQRFEQLSAPLSAKAVEDTAFYRYARLLSRTDVGFSPATFALSPTAFLDEVEARALVHPHAMLTTATHDHKRGEDVRARLAVLSEIPDEWIAVSSRWMARADGADVSAGDRYAILQTLVGAWPPELSADDAAGFEAFAGRVTDWSRKAMREAKLRSSWAQPDEAYEQAGERFIRDVLDEAAGEVAAFADRIAPAGTLGGIVQAVLRSTLPGVPDLYQGCDLLDLSLVDPDNRRPVDYAARMPVAALDAAKRDWRGGRLKQAAITHVLGLRREHPAPFESVGLSRLTVNGARADHVLAFTREGGGQRLTVAVPLRCAAGLTADFRIEPDWWGDTLIETPAARLAAVELFADLPFLVSVD